MKVGVSNMGFRWRVHWQWITGSLFYIWLVMGHQVRLVGNRLDFLYDYSALPFS